MQRLVCLLAGSQKTGDHSYPRVNSTEDNCARKLYKGDRWEDGDSLAMATIASLGVHWRLEAKLFLHPRAALGSR